MHWNGLEREVLLLTLSWDTPSWVHPPPGRNQDRTSDRTMGVPPQKEPGIRDWGIPLWRDTRLCRVATAQGKQGIWFLLFLDRENTGNVVVTQGKFLRHRENIFDCINAKSMFFFTYFQNFLASLHSAQFFISNYCYMNYFYQYIYCTNIFTVLCHILTSINQTYSGQF